MRVVLARMQSRMAGRPPLGSSTPAAMRARFAEDIAGWNADPPPVASVEDTVVPAARRDVPARVYRPVVDQAPQPALICFHGGGWVVGDLDSNDRALRLLANESGVSVISIDYALAPEHPFPAALDECVDVARAVRRDGARLGVDVDRLAIGGDSAGANLALAAAIDLRDAGESWPRFMLLVYGVYARDHSTESHRLYGDGSFGFGTEAMDALWTMYLGAGATGDDSRAAPLRAALDGLPPAYIVAGGLDPLRDDSRRLAARLVEAGGEVEYREYAGVVHGFMSMTRELQIARRATTLAAGALGRALIELPLAGAV